MKNVNQLFLVLFSLAALLWLVACPTSDDPGQVLEMKITAQNDSLLTFDSLIVTAHSEDGKFSQEVFHGVLRDPSQVANMPLDPRVGKNYTVTIVGYRGGKIGVSKEVTFTGTGAQSKDLPIHTDKPETVTVDPTLPEILAPSDTNIAEGDSLRFRVGVVNPWNGVAKLTLKDAIPGAALDTAGRNPGEGYFTWRPSFDQGRAEVYAVTFVYATAEKRVEKITHVKVLNVNRPPKITAVADQKVKENETLTFKVEATDPDHDSLIITATNLPDGATFSAGVFTWKPSVGQAGNYSVRFRAFDGADSDRVAALITVGNVDVPPPLNVKITSPSQDTLVNVPSITILYTVNGTALQKKFLLKDGKNRIRVDTTVLNRAGFDTLWVTLDTVPPGPPVVTGTSPTRSRTPTWTWSSAGNGAGRYRYRLDGEDMSASTQLSETTYTASKDLDVGTHTLYVQERDLAGNWSASGRCAVRIDTTPPGAPLVLVTSLTNNQKPEWSWASGNGDGIQSYRYKLDDANLLSGATSASRTKYSPDSNLSEGLHVLYVQQRDSAGNWSTTGQASVRIDLTPPNAPKVSSNQSSPTNIGQPVWTWKSGGNGGMKVFRYKLDDVTLTTNADSGSDSTYSPDKALSEGKHIFYVQEKDSAGNWSASGSFGLVIDRTPPSPPIFDANLSPLNSVRPNWTWKGAGGGIGIYRCKLDDSSFSKGADTLSTASFTPSGSQNEGPHVLFLQERDSAGNWSATASNRVVVSLRGYVGLSGFSPGYASAFSMVIDKDGTPYLSFKDEANDSKASLMRFVGGQWVLVGPPGFTPKRVSYTSLAISASGLPYVAFGHATDSDAVSVMRFVEGKWEYVGLPSFSAGPVWGASIALNSTGTPYVAIQDGVRDGKATVLKYNSGVWENVGNAGFSSGWATSPIIKFNKSDSPCVLFSDTPNGSKATLMGLNAGTWGNLGAQGFSDDDALYPSLAISKSGVIYAAFADGARGYRATVMRLNNGTWENVGTPGFSKGQASYVTLALDTAGIPYVGYCDVRNDNKATVMGFVAGAWTAVGGPGISTGTAYETAFALSPLGVPYIAIEDGANGNKASVIKTSFDP